VVQEGDSIYSVAFEHGIPWTALVEANNIEAPYTLEVGQTLVILIPLGE
jgi:lipoprotein NlpD